jgi:hypothetical protein
MFTRVLLRPLEGVISMTVGFYYSVLPFVPLWQKGGVIFVPEWPKGEFVSILASFCVWTKSLMCKDAVNRDSTCQSIFRRLRTAKKIEDFKIPCQPSGRRVIPSRRSFVHCSIYPDDVVIPSGR